jgi:hypothetical protein
MAVLTKEAEQKYLADRGGHCPWCGSDQYTGDSVEIGDGEASQVITCLTCHRRWVDVYKLDGALTVDEDDDQDEQAEPPTEEQAQANRDERLAEEVLAAEHMGEKRTIGKVVCAECGSDSVVAVIEERTWYCPPEKAAWPVYDDGELDYRMAVDVAEEEGFKKDSDTTDTGWYCRECGCDSVTVVPADEPAPVEQ